MEKIRNRNKRNVEGREEREEQEDEEEKEEEEEVAMVAMVAMVMPVVVLKTRGTKRRGENSARRSSAAITGCQLAKKSNARFPSLCDAMLMACRCLFSTRCLHTWLDPRGISEMFLAPIRNHILLLSPLSGCVFSFSPLVCLSSRCDVPCSRPAITNADDIANRVSVFSTLSFERKYTFTKNELTVN